MLRTRVGQQIIARLRLGPQRRGFYDCATRPFETPLAQPRVSYHRNLETRHSQKPREERGAQGACAQRPTRSADFETSNSTELHRPEDSDGSFSQSPRATTAENAGTSSQFHAADGAKQVLFKKAPSELEMIPFTDDPLVLEIVHKIRAIELMLTERSIDPFPTAQFSETLVEILHLCLRDHALTIQTLLTLGLSLSRLNRAAKVPICVDPFFNTCLKDDSKIFPAVFYPLTHYLSSSKAFLSDFGQLFESAARTFFPPDSEEIRYLDQRMALIYMNLDDKEKVSSILETHQALSDTSSGTTAFYNLQLIEATSRMDRDQFEAVWTAMQAQQCPPDPTTLSVVLTMLIRCCELEKAEDVFYRMPHVYQFKRTKEHADYCAKAFSHSGRYQSYKQFISAIKTDGVPWTPAVLEFAIRAATLNKHFSTLAYFLLEAFTPQFSVLGDIVAYQVFPTYPVVLYRHLDLTCFHFAVNEAVKAQKYHIISNALDRIRAMYPEAAAYIFQQRDMTWNKRNWSSFQDEALAHGEKS